MTKNNRILALVLAALVLLPAMSFLAKADSIGIFYRPAITFIVENAPEDLWLRLDFEHNGEPMQEYLYLETRLWESYFRLYRQITQNQVNWVGNRADFQNPTLVLLQNGQETRIPFPEDCLNQLSVDDIFVLDLKNNTLSYGLPFWRAALLFLLRLAISMATVLLILRLFKFRRKSSWIPVIVTSLIIQGALSLWLSNLVNYNPKNVHAMILASVFILVIQMAVYCFSLREHVSDRRAGYALTSSIATGAINILYLIKFPL